MVLSTYLDAGHTLGKLEEHKSFHLLQAAGITESYCTRLVRKDLDWRRVKCFGVKKCVVVIGGGVGSVRIGSRQGSGFSQDYVLPWPIRINMFFATNL